MKEILTQKLHAYLVDNHLDLLIALQEEHRLAPASLENYRRLSRLPVLDDKPRCTKVL